MGMLLFLAIFSYTSVMDGLKWSKPLEWFRLVLSPLVIVVFGGTLLPLVYWTWLLYIGLSIVALIVLTLKIKI